eukprot:4444645-Amphidinium_carterae.1
MQGAPSAVASGTETPKCAALHDRSACPGTCFQMHKQDPHPKSNDCEESTRPRHSHELPKVKARNVA